MFTGIIEGLGTVTRLKADGLGRRLVITADFKLDELAVGDSIAVNGACLTASAIRAETFEADLSPETISRTTFSKVKIGDRVNLEKALRISDRLGGHLVSGHIDGIGTLIGRETEANAVILTFAVAEGASRYLIPKGSVAVDGISLTVNYCGQERFSVSIIPHTLQRTTLAFKKIGDAVNIEIDMIAKYVERFVETVSRGHAPESIKKSTIDKELLLKTGFL